MNFIFQLLLAFMAGMALGLFYFGLLWVTTRSLPRVHNPAILTLGSFMIRSAITLTGLYFIMGGRWERLVAGLLGIIAMRIALFSKWRFGIIRPDAYQLNNASE